jgi:integrase
LTGQRREEVAGLAWVELDRKERLWRLPKERAKNGVANDVALSEASIAELDAIAGVTSLEPADRKWPRRGLVFSTTGKTAVSGFSRAKRRWDAAVVKLAAKDQQLAEEEVKIARWTVHDLRRTLATGLQRLGVRFEVTEAVLNHVSGARGGVAGVYQRYGWADEKRAALDAWARHVDSILKPAETTNVVPIRRAASGRRRPRTEPSG